MLAAPAVLVLTMILLALCGTRVFELRRQREAVARTIGTFDGLLDELDGLRPFPKG